MISLVAIVKPIMCAYTGPLPQYTQSNPSTQTRRPPMAGLRFNPSSLWLDTDHVSVNIEPTLGKVKTAAVSIVHT